MSGQEDYIFVMLSPSYFSPLVMASMSIHMLNVVRLVAPVSNLVATAWFDFLQNGTISEKDPSNRLYIASTRFWISACVAPSDHSRHFSRPRLEITSVCLSLTFPSCCICFLSDFHILQWYTMFVSSNLCLTCVLSWSDVQVSWRGYYGSLQTLRWSLNCASLWLSFMARSPSTYHITATGVFLVQRCMVLMPPCLQSRMLESVSIPKP